MRKFLSLFAAVLVALVANAAVLLPATLDVTNVSFRSEGMPDFVIEEGQDYAGTYFDMGAHDSSNDTLLYAEWNVTIQPIKYNVAVDVYNTNSWRVQLDLLNQADEVVKAIRYKGSSGQKGQFAIGSLDLSDLEAGDYKVRARAATAWSAMKLKDVIFAADYQGVSVELPGTLQPAYAVLSSGASVANNAIAFAPSTAYNEYATWNVSFAAAGNYTVTIDMTATNGHTYGVALLSADGATEIATVAEAQAWDTGIKELGAITVPEAGNYKIKLTNATQWSEAVLNGITFAAAASVEPNVKTIYCKVAQDWWKADGAAVGAYAWKGETANAAWPGARMAAVEGEADLWKIDLDVNAYESIIFTRVNGTGDIADWGAKTADLTIPTDDKDLYTITSATEVWGAPGVTGEWSKYAASEPVTPTLENGFYLIGKINGVEGWTAADLSADRKFTANPENPAEFVVSATLAVGDEIKVVNVVNDAITAWYPAEGGNYVIDAAHAGEKTIYFQPDYKADWVDFGGYFYIAANEEPAVDFTKPFTLKFNGNGSSDNSNSFTVESGVAAIFDEASAPYVSALNTVSNVYSARTIADDPSSLKFGTSSKKGTLAFTIGQAIEVDSIIVNATQYGNNAAEVTVNGTKFDLTQGNKVPTDCKLTPEGEVSTITIAQTGSERIYLRYVKVYPKQAGVEPRLADGFYLNGSHAEWAVANLTAELKFEPTEENPAEYKLTTTLTEGQEIKVVKVEADAIVAWYPAEGGNYVVDAAHAGENKDIYFQPDYKADWVAFGGHIWIGANEEPQPTKYCEFATGHLKDANFGDANGRILLTIQKIADSNNIRVAIKNNTAAGNTKAGLNYLWVNATGAKNNNATYGSHEAEDVEEVSVIVEFDEAQESYVFNNIHWAYAGWGGEWAIDGLTVSAAELCEASAPIVELNYYMKNNWDAASDWTWKAMTKDGENYKLEKVVFGGTGVNYNTAESDDGSSWVPVANIAGDAISAKDTVTFVLDPAAGTVTATLIGKYNDPNPGVHTYTVAGNLAAAFGTAWDPENAHNDMVLNGVGIYLWEKTELTLPEGTIKFKVCEDHAWDVAYPAQDYELAIPEAGVYTIYITFNPDTKEVTANAQKTGDATVTVDYYLVGSVKGWEAKAENIFTLNAEAGEGIEEYVIETTLEVGEGLKVLSSTGTWYPEGMGNEYVVDQDHAGATTIYFRPAGNAEWAAFGGYMYVVPTGGAGIDAVDANAPAVKVLRNGQILIKKGDKTYNVMGAIVR